MFMCNVVGERIRKSPALKSKMSSFPMLSCCLCFTLLVLLVPSVFSTTNSIVDDEDGDGSGNGGVFSCYKLLFSAIDFFGIL